MYYTVLVNFTNFPCYTSLCQTEDQIILLTMGILFQKVKNNKPDDFHDIHRYVHRIFQKTHVPYYIILDT